MQDAATESSVEKLLLKKWYFAANGNALQRGFDQIQVAVNSARQNTSLKPFCIVDQFNGNLEAADQLSWLEDRGVTLIPRSAELFGFVSDHFGPSANVFSGHWLRCDIPIIETEQDFILYTDIDVMFRSDVAVSLVKPKFIACAPEHKQDDYSYFNSGVMIMNIPALRETREDLISSVKNRLGSMQPHDDQGAFNEVYRNDWERIPNSWNWKPYWGISDDAVITHFHGPKPSVVRRMMTGDIKPFGAEYLEIYNRNVEGYRYYLDEFDRYASL